MKKNILFCSVGRRGTLLQNVRKSMNGCGKIVATDNSPVAPALYFADSIYQVPRITDEQYTNKILEICKKENINALTTLIDPEIEIMANHYEQYVKNGILPLCPNKVSAHICFDKYEMFKHFQKKGVRTVLTYKDLNILKKALKDSQISFPVK